MTNGAWAQRSTTCCTDMNLKTIIPTGPEIARETIIVLCGLLAAAFILSRIPALRKFVTDNSLTLKDGQGNTLL